MGAARPRYEREPVVGHRPVTFPRSRLPHSGTALAGLQDERLGLARSHQPERLSQAVTDDSPGPAQASVCHILEDRPRGTVVDEVVRPDLPEVNFDWDPEIWGKAARRNITSSPSPVGVVGDFVTSAINPNIALWRGGPAATAIEVQSIEWLKEMLEYPPEAEGVFTSGGQFANIGAHAVIRDQASRWDVRRRDMNPGEGAANLRVYASEEIHYCHQQAAELLGMESEAVRLVPVDEGYRMRADALDRMILEDRERGNRPIAIVATAGTVGTGAVDPIPELLRVARSQSSGYT